MKSVLLQVYEEAVEKNNWKVKSDKQLKIPTISSITTEASWS